MPQESGEQTHYLLLLTEGIDEDGPPMPLMQLSVSDSDVLDQLAGITGLGWTASILGYLGMVFGYGSSLLTRLAFEPQSLLYLGGALLVATFGLDRLQNRLARAE